MGQPVYSGRTSLFCLTSSLVLTKVLLSNPETAEDTSIFCICPQLFEQTLLCSPPHSSENEASALVKLSDFFFFFFFFAT